MKSLLSCLGVAVVASLVSGCLVSPVERSGGPGSVTVTNSNPSAIMTAAQDVFPGAGYQVGPVSFPNSISFDKGSSKFANIMWGSYGNPQTIRVRVNITRIPGTNDFRLSPKAYSVSSAGEAGFEDARPLMSLWASQFGPLLRQVAAQAGGAGAM
ncbi:MAG: hypothetical protein D4R65_01050 [Verrucomicrobiaceae bacterium]|nr:MAG: hypothetical protein D4R65_01050 [Verrucomicrobiaceae bacterium]